ncbi:MAG: beta-N-acetylhexosaminidase [Zhaonellaceae bacterium]|jgi:beta-N-acetylhexosaminidase|nr:beta-N-acetylhexosaminidase [Clostridia bacterium]
MKYLYFFCAVVTLAMSFSIGFVLADGSIQFFSESAELINEAENLENDYEEETFTDEIAETVASMSLAEKIGQLVMVGVDGYEHDENSKHLIKNYHVGGFVLLKQNIKNLEQMLDLINSLKKANSVNKIPLFLAIDEEGGRISRLPQEFAKIPSSKAIGEINNGEISYQVGSIIGEELKMLGLNMNFAPVLDINSNAENPVIGDRAFGDKPGIVSKLGIQTMKGLQEQNIVSVVKHFPGHGDTSVDSHYGLPIVNNDLDRLESFELLPFYEAVKNGADAVMIAHIMLPKIDANSPATFSKTIINDILRNKMDFEGVVITDDMTMGAINDNFDLGKAAVESIKAGSDIILVCHDFAKEEAVLKALYEAAENKDIPITRIDQSVYRILKMKQKYGVNDKAVKDVNPKIINSKIQKLFH